MPLYHHEGYKNLLTYKQGLDIYHLTKEFTSQHLHPIKDSRLISHMNDSARSISANICEGYKRNNTRSYLEFLSFSRASNEELKGDYTELEREYKEEIRKIIGADKEEMIGKIEEILTKIYGEDCMLGRQIKSLETKFVTQGDEKEVLKNKRINYQKDQLGGLDRYW